MCRGAFLNGWIPNLANLSKTRILYKWFLTDPMFSVIYFIFGREIFRKPIIKKTMGLLVFIYKIGVLVIEYYPAT